MDIRRDIPRLVDGRKDPWLRRRHMKKLYHWINARKEDLPELSGLPSSRLQRLEIYVLTQGVGDESLDPQRRLSSRASSNRQGRANSSLQFFVFLKEPR
jgi:hypothetical protein